VIGASFGLTVLFLGVGCVIAYVKKFFPDEVAIQQRHDGPVGANMERRALMGPAWPARRQGTPASPAAR